MLLVCPIKSDVSARTVCFLFKHKRRWGFTLNTQRLSVHMSDKLKTGLHMFGKTLIAVVFSCFAGFAQAATLATLDIDGNYTIAPNEGGTVINVNGTFAANLLMPLPVGPANYTVSALFTLNGADIFDDDLPPFTADANASAPSILGISAFLISNAGSKIDFPGGEVKYDGTLLASTPTGGSGTYEIFASTDIPASLLLSSFLDTVDPSEVLSSFFVLPNDDTGSFEISLTVDVQPVPLPAGLPLLLAGLAGFAVLRRKQRNKA